MLVTATLAAGAAEAQSLGGRHMIQNPIDRAALQQLRPWVRDPSPGTPVPPIEFKVPAEFTAVVRCDMRPAGLNCYLVPGQATCPSTVEIEISGGTTTHVPVLCTGPDDEGYCDCDFVEGR